MKPRLLAPTARLQLADDLEGLARQLRTSHAHNTQQALAETAAIGYPNRASGAAGNPNNPVDENGDPVQPDTATERAALTPDPAAGYAQAVLKDLRLLAIKTPALWSALQQYDPDRPVAACPRCGHPFARGFTRCQNMIDGRQCGSSDKTERRCANYTCDVLIPPSVKPWDGRCDTCASFRKANGRDRIVTAGLDLQDNVIIEGVAHA